MNPIKIHPANIALISIPAILKPDSDNLYIKSVYGDVSIGPPINIKQIQFDRLVFHVDDITEEFVDRDENGGERVFWIHCSQAPAPVKQKDT